MLNEYVIKGVATDVDIAKSIVIVRGIDSHQIFFHSIYQEFTPNLKHHPTVFYAPKIFALDFYDDNFGNLDSSGAEKWHYDQSHDLIVSVNDFDLIMYSWYEKPAEIRCFTDNPAHIGNDFKFKFYANVSNCADKKALGDVISKDLVICG